MPSNDTNDARFANVLRVPNLIAQVLSDDGTYPNHARLPLLVYLAAVHLPQADPAATFEALFKANSWGGAWRNGVYSFHHYHSTAHEVLGVYRGSARLQLGGPEGPAFEVQPGDVVIIPAGVAHKNLGARDAFGVVGAYPVGQWPDINRGRAGERPRADREIAQVALPAADPVYGARGPLTEHWT
jgi:uncharacterized protein YjlB